jgi:hypothetical protein
MVPDKIIKQKRIKDFLGRPTSYSAHYLIQPQAQFHTHADWLDPLVRRFSRSR